VPACNDRGVTTDADVARSIDSARARQWLPAGPQLLESSIRDAIALLNGEQTVDLVESLIERNRQIHEVECVNLNPATNVMNPRAEAALSAGLGARPSLGYAGEKYEMGLEAIEQIEVIAADLACRVFGARFAEIRVGSGALANLYAFMATCQPGDSIIVPPATIGGHITHRSAGAAGLYGLDIHECPIDARRFTIDLDGLAELAARVQPKLITMGASLNLLPHPVEEVHAIAHDVGAALLFDAAHACGMFAGRVWPNPLDLGADLMTMSTYKSLGGPAGGLLLTNRADLAERIDAIAYPGLTANFDAGKTASLAITLRDWLEGGHQYAVAMTETASALAGALAGSGMPVFSTELGYTTSHQFAIDAVQWGGGHQAALTLRDANILACAIGLPGGNEWSGLRLGTPEIVRWGMTATDMPELANLIVEALHGDPFTVAPNTTEFRSRFATLHHIHP
jgi:glycine hydroxymethyltransferase